MKIVFNQELLGIMDIFGKITHVSVKDCFRDEDTLYFIVDKMDIGKAIGKGAENIKKIKQRLNKNVRVIAYGNNVVSFVKNFIYPTKVDDIAEEEGVVSIRSEDRKVKGLLVGRDGKNLKLINKAVKRFFDVEVKVV